MVLPEERVKTLNKVMAELKRLEKEYAAATTEQDKAKLLKLAKEAQFTANFELNTLSNAMDSEWRRLRATAKTMGL